MDGYAKKMEESSVRHFRIQIKRKKTQTNNKDFNTHIEVKEQGQT